MAHLGVVLRRLCAACLRVVHASELRLSACTNARHERAVAALPCAQEALAQHQGRLVETLSTQELEDLQTDHQVDMCMCMCVCVHVCVCVCARARAHVFACYPSFSLSLSLSFSHARSLSRSLFRLATLSGGACTCTARAAPARMRGAGGCQAPRVRLSSEHSPRQQRWREAQG